jgi:subtilisin family serine protease
MTDRLHAAQPTARRARIAQRGLRRWLAALALLAVMLTGAHPADADGPGDEPPPSLAAIVARQVMVRIPPPAEATDVLGDLPVEASVEASIPELDVWVLEIDAEDIDAALAWLVEQPGVAWAERNQIASAAQITPDDPGYPDQYGLEAIRAPYGWETTTGSASVVIGVLDTGIDASHPDLAGKVMAGYDFVNDDADPADDNGHGTHVAGIAAAQTDNATGVAGVSWGARVMPVKVLNAAAVGTYANVAQGIIWAVDNGAAIVNLSLGGAAESEALADAVDYADARGVLVVAAAGNTGSPTVLFPARLPKVVAVAATDEANARAALSNYGPEIDVAAPGIAIYSTDLGGSYGDRSGTSMATAFVSGLAALIAGEIDSGDPDAVRDAIEDTALDIAPAGRDDFTGYGLIQADAALDEALTSNDGNDDGEGHDDDDEDHGIVGEPPPDATVEAQASAAGITLSAEVVMLDPGAAWRFTIANPGDGPTPGLTFRADLDPALTLRQVEAPGGTARPPEEETIWVDLPPLPPGESVTVVLEVDLPSGTSAARARQTAQAAERYCVTGAVASAVETACLEVAGPSAAGLPDVLPATGGGRPPDRAGGVVRWVALAGLGCAAALFAGLGMSRPRSRGDR